MPKEISRRCLLLGGLLKASLSTGRVFAQEDYLDESNRLIPSERGGTRPPENESRVCSGVWVGTCTYYSHAGCVGCSPGQIMANGEKFREWGMTIAFMELPLNTFVRVTNLETGKSVVAKVADRGGFWKYGILADLSLGVSVAIGNKSQSSRIQINTLDCE